MILAPSWINCPIECKSVVRSTAAGKIIPSGLSFALTIQLLPPLRHIVQARLIICQYLHRFSFLRRMRMAAYCSASLFSNGSSSDNVLWSAAPCINRSISAPADCYRQQAYRCQYRKSSADVIRNDKALIAFFRRQVLKGPSGFVSRRVNPLSRFLFSRTYVPKFP